MEDTIRKNGKRNLLLLVIIFLSLSGGIIVCLIGRSKSTDDEELVYHVPAYQTKSKPQPVKPEIESEEVRGEIALNDELTEFDNLPLPSPFDEEVHFTPYKPGFLIYHVDRYVEDEARTAKQIKSESFDETLRNMSDWKTNYYKLVIQDAEPNPAHPSSLKLIIYSRRFAKLVEHGFQRLTREERLQIVKQIKQDLDRWRNLWTDGQRIRASENRLHSVTQKSDKLIIPLTLRINTTILLAGTLSVEEALPVVIESVKTISDDTNWSAVGYTCDKILTSLYLMELAPRQRRIVDEYHAWKIKQDAKIFEYETVELPSFKSARRPHERATSLGAALDFSEGKVSIEIPPQYLYITRSLHQSEGYYDPTGYSEILKKTVDFARVYCEAEP